MSAGERECCPFTVAVIVSIESFFAQNHHSVVHTWMCCPFIIAVFLPIDSFFAQNHGSSAHTWMRCPFIIAVFVPIDSFFAALRMTAAHLIMGGWIWRLRRHIHPFPPAKPCHSERSEESVHVSFADFREVSLLFRAKNPAAKTPVAKNSATQRCLPLSTYLVNQNG
jgi:hypothetical protein